MTSLTQLEPRLSEPQLSKPTFIQISCFMMADMSSILSTEAALTCSLFPQNDCSIGVRSLSGWSGFAQTTFSVIQ